MAIPVASILSAVAPLVMGAVDLYRRRKEATAENVGADSNTASRESLQIRLQGLEASDLEQTRLISELSRSLEALAKTFVRVHEANLRTQRMLWVFGAVAVVSLTLAIWSLTK